MDSRPDVPRWAAVVAVALTAAGHWFGGGLQPLWWLAWLAPLPLLAWAAHARSAAAVAVATFTALAIGGANMWHYLTEVIRLPLAASALVILLPALAMVPVILLFRALIRRGRPLAALVSVPLGTTGLSWAMAALSPHGTYGHVAYTQMDAAFVVQLAALGGVWMVGFAVWLLPAALAVAIAPVAPRRPALRAAALGIALLTLALGYGAWRVHAAAPGKPVRIGLVNIGVMHQAEADLAQPRGQRMLRDYLQAMEQLAQSGAQVVVAPESALLLRSHALPQLQALADRHRVRVLIGAEDHSDPRRKRNASLVFEPGAGAPASYFKQHLIPGFEDRYTPGDSRTMLPGTPRTGVAICKDLDFTATSRAYGRLGAQLLLVPAWDFEADAWLHGRMAVLRGVEGGFAVARSARDGHLTLSDDRGRVLAQASSAGKAGTTLLLGDVPLRETRTPYAWWGDAFGWLSLLGATALAPSLPLRRRR